MWADYILQRKKKGRDLNTNEECQNVATQRLEEYTKKSKEINYINQ